MSRLFVGYMEDAEDSDGELGVAYQDAFEDVGEEEASKTVEKMTNDEWTEGKCPQEYQKEECLQNHQQEEHQETQAKEKEEKEDDDDDEEEDDDDEEIHVLSTAQDISRLSSSVQSAPGLPTAAHLSRTIRQRVQGVLIRCDIDTEATGRRFELVGIPHGHAIFTQPVCHLSALLRLPMQVCFIPPTYSTPFPGDSDPAANGYGLSLVERFPIEPEEDAYHRQFAELPADLRSEAPGNIIVVREDRGGLEMSLVDTMIAFADTRGQNTEVSAAVGLLCSHKSLEKRRLPAIFAAFAVEHRFKGRGGGSHNDSHSYDWLGAYCRDSLQQEDMGRTPDGPGGGH